MAVEASGVDEELLDSGGGGGAALWGSGEASTDEKRRRYDRTNSMERETGVMRRRMNDSGEFMVEMAERLLGR